MEHAGAERCRQAGGGGGGQDDREDESAPPIRGRAMHPPAQHRDGGRGAENDAAQRHGAVHVGPHDEQQRDRPEALAREQRHQEGDGQQREQVRAQRPDRDGERQPDEEQGEPRPRRTHHQPVDQHQRRDDERRPTQRQQRHPAEVVTRVRNRLPEPLVVPPRPTRGRERIRLHARHGAGPQDVAARAQVPERVGRGRHQQRPRHEHDEQETDRHVGEADSASQAGEHRGRVGCHDGAVSPWAAAPRAPPICRRDNASAIHLCRARRPCPRRRGGTRTGRQSDRAAAGPASARPRPR